jgi:transcriptional regulator with XRE-family HTH domain
MLSMPIDELKKTSRRKSIGDAIKTLRKRLKISQEGLTDEIGGDLTACTVSRWECGKLLPYPKTRERLAEIALTNGYIDLAAAFEATVPFDEWVTVLRVNAPEEYTHMMATSICALNKCNLDHENQEQTEQEIAIKRQFRTMTAIANGLLHRLAELSKAGEAVALPPQEHYRRFWAEFVNREPTDGSVGR